MIEIVKNRPKAKEKTKKKQSPANRANELDGSNWVKSSISIWSDVRFTTEERRLKHPAMFPQALIEKLITCFTNKNQKVILDPFCGSGSTVVAAEKLGKHGIGVELYPKFIQLGNKRLSEIVPANEIINSQIIKGDSRNLQKFIKNESVDLAITSPPYWDILKQRRTADCKESEHYGENNSDLGNFEGYKDFLSELGKTFGSVHKTLKPGAYFIVNVMDLRKGPNFFPLHMDIVPYANAAGFFLDDIIIWDRRMDYNNLRALGYPAVFRVNKVHEFLMIFRKPKAV